MTRKGRRKLKAWGAGILIASAAIVCVALHYSGNGQTPIQWVIAGSVCLIMGLPAGLLMFLIGDARG